MPGKQNTILDGNKIFDVSELFRCYFDLYSMFFRCFISMFSLSMFCLFYVFAFRCFVVLFFVIDPTYQPVITSYQHDQPEQHSLQFLQIPVSREYYKIIIWKAQGVPQ